MSVSVRISDELYEAAKRTAKAELRSIPQQIEFWAKLGRAAYDNPDLPIDFIRDILMARMEDPAGSVPEVLL
ncbi:MAG: ParD-like family protein [Candidatus Competibacteraceae bacterium]